MDETTDTSRHAHLLVRYVDEESIKGIALAKTTGEEVCQVASEGLDKWGLNWKDFVGVCMDGPHVSL